MQVQVYMHAFFRKTLAFWCKMSHVKEVLSLPKYKENAKKVQKQSTSQL